MADNDRLVFVLEDNTDIARLVCNTLGEHGYRTEAFSRAGDLRRRVRVRRPDLCIVDLGLPDEDGFEVVRGLRATGDMPVIIMTGRAGVTDRVLGLELGADDYVVKPFEPRELVARVNAVLRRARRDASAATSGEGALARFAGWTFDHATHTLTARDGVVTELSTAEARLLMAFVTAPNRILSRDSLLGDDGRDDRAPFDRAIDVRISRLRHKLERDPKNPQLIKTVYGSGYLFASSVQWVNRGA